MKIKIKISSHLRISEFHCNTFNPEVHNQLGNIKLTVIDKAYSNWIIRRHSSRCVLGTGNRFRHHSRRVSHPPYWRGGHVSLRCMLRFRGLRFVLSCAVQVDSRDNRVASVGLRIHIPPHCGVKRYRRTSTGIQSVENCKDQAEYQRVILITPFTSSDEQRGRMRTLLRASL